MSSGSTCRLTISCENLSANFSLLRSRIARTCRLAAVVKANAYGIGVAVAVPAFEKAGCKMFYVAELSEAFQVRKLTSHPIAVLGGLREGEKKEFIASGFIPVLNSLPEIEVWKDQTEPAIWHIDTGMNRLGLKVDDVEKAVKISERHPTMVMTHFIASDEKDSPLGTTQVRRFDSAISPFLFGVPQSLCNSSAIFRESAWHRDEVRSGMALYGLNPVPETENPMYPVVTLEAQILQIRQAGKGETVGYNAAETLRRSSLLGTVGIGYADGFLRAGSGKAALYWKGIRCPVLGRVSMDTVIVDLTDAPLPAPVQGEWMEVIGKSQSADSLATQFGTIGYEVLTSLSNRAKRIITPIKEAA